MTVSQAPSIDRAKVSAYRIPTEGPESDGTLQWDSTTLVLVELSAGGTNGLGYSYADTATARLIQDQLLPLVKGRDPTAIAACASAMQGALRNLGTRGIGGMALSAVDNALWDLKAKLLDLPVVTLLGAVRPAIPVYASGGFTSYSLKRLQQQVEQWGGEGYRFVKVKVGREPAEDIKRVKAARKVLGDKVELFVDGNGAYSVKQALFLARAFQDYRVSWLEEPVASDDLEGLRLLREQGPAGMDISAGEYGYDSVYFRRMLEAGAVDVLQADATRCAGLSGFMKAAALCEAYNRPLSSHCAPLLHLHACCAAVPARHLEYFYDHARIESMLFEGGPAVSEGCLGPDLSRPGFGVAFKYRDASRFEV